MTGGWTHGAEVFLKEAFNGNKLFEDNFKKGAQRKWGVKKVAAILVFPLRPEIDSFSISKNL